MDVCVGVNVAVADALGVMDGVAVRLGVMGDTNTPMKMVAGVVGAVASSVYPLPTIVEESRSVEYRYSAFPPDAEYVVVMYSVYTPASMRPTRPCTPDTAAVGFKFTVPVPHCAALQAVFRAPVADVNCARASKRGVGACYYL